MSAEAPFEVITMGRVGVDIYPLQIGVGLEDVTTFGKYLGGSATNVAIAAARLGRRSAIVTRTGDDPFGRFVHQALEGFGVDDRFVSSVPHLATPVVFCEIFPPDDFPLYFYREPKAPDMEIRADELDLDALGTADVLWATVTGLSDEPSREATLTALRTRNRRHPTILDLDYRSMFWDSREQAREQVSAALDLVTVAVGNLDECGPPSALVIPTERPTRSSSVASTWPSSSRVRRVCSDGRPRPTCASPGGCRGRERSRRRHAFGGSLCHGLLSEWSLERTLQFANAAGAIVASRLACADAIPTVPEVDAFLAGNPHPVPADQATLQEHP